MNTITYWDVWHFITGCLAQLRLRYHELCSHSVEVSVYKPLKTTIKRWHCSGNEKNKLKQQSTVNIQNTEDNLKILLRILSQNKLPITSTSIIHLCDYTLYAWTQIDPIRVRTANGSGTFRRSSLQFGKAPFNPHLPGGYTFL